MFVVARLRTEQFRQNWVLIQAKLWGRLLEFGRSLNADFSINRQDPRRNSMPPRENMARAYAIHLNELANLMRTLRVGRMEQQVVHAWVQSFNDMLVSGT